MTLLKEKSEKHDLHVNYCQSFYLHLKKIIHTQMFIYKATTRKKKKSKYKRDVHTIFLQ